MLAAKFNVSWVQSAFQVKLLNAIVGRIEIELSVTDLFMRSENAITTLAFTARPMVPFAGVVDVTRGQVPSTLNVKFFIAEFPAMSIALTVMTAVPSGHPAVPTWNGAVRFTTVLFLV
jgi:hypothetical protein